MAKERGLGEYCPKAGLKHISKTYIQNIKIPYPENVEVQKKIAAILEKAERLKEWRKEADMLTDEFLKSTFLEMFGESLENKNGWKNKFLSECIVIPLNSGWSPNCSENYGGIPVYSLANLKDNGLTTDVHKFYYGEKPIKGYDLEIGDILISRSNTKELVGRAGLYKGVPRNIIYPDLTIRIRVNNKILNPVFFEKYLQLNSVRKTIEGLAHGSSGSMVKISQKNLLNFELQVPPLELQNKFARIVQEIETLHKKQSQSKQHIDDLFNALMQKAFKGELACQ